MDCPAGRFVPQDHPIHKMKGLFYDIKVNAQLSRNKLNTEVKTLYDHQGTKCKKSKAALCLWHNASPG